MYLIGLDIGTTSIGGVLVDGNSGDIAKSMIKDNQSECNTANSWEHCQNPDWIWHTVREVLAELSSDDLEICGIGITGQMHGILYVDVQGNPISPLYTWLDKRGSLPFDGSTSYAEHLSLLTTCPVSPGFGMVTHYYNTVQGILPEKAVKLCTIADFIAMKLCGAKEPIIDPTLAASLGCFDLKTGQFDQAALRAARIAPSILPLIKPTGTVIGQTEHGVPVACAAGDNQASFLGAVRDIEHSILVNIGTGSQISVFSNQLLQLEGLETRPFPGGGYILVGAPLGGGKSYALLERFFREVCTVFAGSEESLYERMNALALAAAKIPPGEGLQVHTQFFGTREDPAQRGAINRISANNFLPQHLVAGFLEGMTEELFAYYMKLPESLKQSRKVLVGSGNGVRQNQALRSRLAQAFMLPLELPKYAEEASYGAAICAGVGIGLYKVFTSSPGRS